MEAIRDRALLMEWIRSEVIGPRRYLQEPRIVGEHDVDIHEWETPVAWKVDDRLQEVIYFNNETPLIKYGAGILHPRRQGPETAAATSEVPGESVDVSDATVSDEMIDDEYADDGFAEDNEDDVETGYFGSDYYDDETDDNETEVAEFKRQSSMGVSVCISDSPGAVLVVSMPARRTYPWQEPDSQPFELNGYYRRRVVEAPSLKKSRKIDLWYRSPATTEESRLAFPIAEFEHNKKVTKQIFSAVSSIRLEVSVISRKAPSGAGWIATVVLTNESALKEHERVTSQLFQSYFEVHLQDGSFEPYPEATRSFESLDTDEQSLELLYRDSPQWGIGHSCSAAWDSDAGATPKVIYAEIMPATELPSMTPDVMVDGKRLSISMRDMMELSDDYSGDGWRSLDQLISGYQEWIKIREGDVPNLDLRYQSVALRHVEACKDCLHRMQRGLRRLKDDRLVRDAFRNANQAMLLQQIASKQLKRRKLIVSPNLRPSFDAQYAAPLDLLRSGRVSPHIGTWRAFQIAFFLLSLPGVTDEHSGEREIVDLIWFPTGGGKTEAYLAVAACYLWHQRLLGRDEVSGMHRDGTGVIMRYTLRMLTTQQFQRASSLMCALEVLRTEPSGAHGLAPVKAYPFSLGLWVGQAGSPNNCKQAKDELARYKRDYGKRGGAKLLNPLVLLECPWCRAEMGVVQGKMIHGIDESEPKLKCSDPACVFGGQYSELPIEVIDERIYKRPPSFIIATVDKFAMAAYRPGDHRKAEVAALFGREFDKNGYAIQVRVPPGLIIQDELHLISGPIGTMYSLYESSIEDLCTLYSDGISIRPKIIASTATIRGAEHQVKTLYNRDRTFLFPCPGLQMGDSFFGRYAVDSNTGRRARGRMYLGLSTPDYRSSIKLQVESLTAPLYRTWMLDKENRDPWWTLLVYYNSLREIGIGQTLFNGQIRGRLNYLRRRDGLEPEYRRYLNDIRELSSRLTQSGLIDAMDTLATPYRPDEKNAGVDVCLTSNIIEVGVDIDRLSLMAVVGQPRSTASYIQITGRVGRRWAERPGLILMLYNHNRRRDISHYEHFQSYHHRLYEQVEPTSATPYSLSALQRGLMGVMLLRLRMKLSLPVNEIEHYLYELDTVRDLMLSRAREAQTGDPDVIEKYFTSITEEMKAKWRRNPEQWEEYPPVENRRYLILWPGEEYSPEQQHIGIPVPTSLRHVDTSSKIKTRLRYH